MEVEKAMAKSALTVPEPRLLSSGKWFIQLRLGGESVPVTALSEKKCSDEATYIKAQYKAGKRTEERSKANPTLKKAIDDYITVRSNTLSPSTIDGYRRIQKNRFKGVMQKPVKDIKD
ncbi:MAG: hypothetical protein RR365_13045 [Bacteroides sp.]